MKLFIRRILPLFTAILLACSLAGCSQEELPSLSNPPSSQSASVSEDGTGLSTTGNSAGDSTEPSQPSGETDDSSYTGSPADSSSKTPTASGKNPTNSSTGTKQPSSPAGTTGTTKRPQASDNKTTTTTTKKPTTTTKKPTTTQPTVPGNVDYSQKTPTISSLAGKYKTQGRTSMVNGGLSLDYTASSLEFNLYCEGDVSIQYQASNIPSGEGQGLYFTIIVDGTVKSRSASHVAANGKGSLTLATGLKRGYHTFQIFRQTEIQRGAIQIQSLTFRGEMAPRPADKKLYIEFIGDSMTTGYGNLTTVGNSIPSAPIHQDGTKTFAFLTAQQLDADCSVVAIQGIGVACGWQAVTMPTVYPTLRYWWDHNAPYAFDKKPQIVVINLGENDFATSADKGISASQIEQAFTSFLKTVQQKNPGAKVVWAYGLMSSTAETACKNAVAACGGQAKGLYTLELPCNVSGGNRHPSVQGHEAAAKVLTQFLQTLL